MRCGRPSPGQNHLQMSRVSYFDRLRPFGIQDLRLILSLLLCLCELLSPFFLVFLLIVQKILNGDHSILLPINPGTAGRAQRYHEGVPQTSRCMYLCSDPTFQRFHLNFQKLSYSGPIRTKNKQAWHVLPKRLWGCPKYQKHKLQCLQSRLETLDYQPSL